MAPGNTGVPYVTTFAPAALIAPGVWSSGSTLIPPVQKISSISASCASMMASLMVSISSPTIRTIFVSTGNLASLSSTTGEKVSWILPWRISLPVTKIAAFIRWYGKMLKTGELTSSCKVDKRCSSISKGTTRIAATLSPAFTGILFSWEEITISSAEFRRNNFSALISSKPSHSANSSILPSLGVPALKLGPMQISRRIAAASSS